MYARFASSARSRRSSTGSTPSGSTSRSNLAKNASLAGLVRRFLSLVLLQDTRTAIRLSISATTTPTSSSGKPQAISLHHQADPKERPPHLRRHVPTHPPGDAPTPTSTNTDQTTSPRQPSSKPPQTATKATQPFDPTHHPEPTPRRDSSDPMSKMPQPSPAATLDAGRHELRSSPASEGGRHAYPLADRDGVRGGVGSSPAGEGGRHTTGPAV